MGILNVTPDSFSDGGKYADTESAVKAALAMVQQGADFLDIGGESTRPGSEPVSVEEQIRRVVPVIEKLAREVDIPLSVDTSKAEVAEAALSAGADIVNDITAGTADPRMFSLVAGQDASMVLMHMKGTPKTMQSLAEYTNVVEEVNAVLWQQTEIARRAGVKQIFIDPGIGFAKRLEHNIALIRGIGRFHNLGCPILIGLSRKSFLGELLNLPVTERLEGTAAAVAASVL
ncbi:MAG: dihydropteroate synthase, partial [Bacteroidota bacterium]